MRLAWFGTRSWEADCLRAELPFFYSVTLEKPPNVVKGCNLESILGKRLFWGSGDLFDPKFQRVLIDTAVDLDKFDHVISYAPLADHNDWPPNVLWKAPRALLKLFADKALTRRWLASNGFPACPAIEIKKGSWPSHSGSMVLQALNGSCGSGTYIGDASQLQRFFISTDWPRAIVGPLMDGWVVNGHIVIFPNGSIEIPWPSIQLISAFPTREFIQPLYGGNDFSAFQELIPLTDRVLIRRYLYRLGELVARRGYKGVLGADLIYNPENRSIGFIEVNARMQGSTGLLSKIEAAAGFTPSTTRSFLALLGHKVPIVKYHEDLPRINKQPVSQYFLREAVTKEVAFDKNHDTLFEDTGYRYVQNLAVKKRFLSTRSVFHESNDINSQDGSYEKTLCQGNRMAAL